MGPCPGRIAGLSVDVLGLSTVPRELTGLTHGCPGLALQHCILSHGDDILELGLSIQKIQQLGMREAAIGFASKDARSEEDSQALLKVLQQNVGLLVLDAERVGSHD